ncbi:SDR family oxidoreductase [Desulfonatronospira sp.]|uniref:SDR family oxidoreductase n=1 Tax=Desulfonatronospira sp. TaxID=1962951 RepID=UPI0025B9D678|nr:SDR family oxidoreductase [Desulfonatronospira sp.]
MSHRPILVTGATGYIGGRLIPILLEKGYMVRAVARSGGKLACRPWAGEPGVKTVVADMQDLLGLRRAARGCRAAFYLVHSMKSRTSDQEHEDKSAAVNMSRAASSEGLERIIYLSDLGEDSREASRHLQLRAEVGRILQSGKVPVTILRSSVILGSGSAAFDLIRYLVQRMPVIPAPRWINTLSQPIAVQNVLQYLAGCLEKPQTSGKIYEIGGPEVLSYADLFKVYAREAGLKRRLIIRMPGLGSRILTYFAHLITPIPANMAETIIQSMKDKAVCRDQEIKALIPQDLLSCSQAVAAALNTVNRDEVQTCWMDAGHLEAPEWIMRGDVSYADSTVLEYAQKVEIRGTARELWPLLENIGGSRGWYGMDFLWRIRGDMDRLVGGPGLRRGRRDQSRLMVGDALDFWRVLRSEPPYVLLLLSEMKLPGEAMLEFRLKEVAQDRVELVQTARLLPHGPAGILYWYLTYPLHGLVFRSMLLNMARRSGHEVLKGPETDC